ncbi:MAG: indolepyruvate oxidoreductase subunit beta [Spirochaetes bacterium]|jgi:indolepyruvate ferredoxin oxidoreductase beta subunit|nr:indolepyruvate oxidoreductase subunit beta [Spirochaetota bacterium]
MVNVIFAGVGGQGVILASKVLMEVAKDRGYDVKESEVHGMAQRGGSVECNVRYGEKVYSPLIEKGTADYVVSLEELEILRKIDYLSPDGAVIVNREKIDPAPVQTGAMSYPNDIQEWIKSRVKQAHFVDTVGALKEAGSKKALNIVMLGFLSRFLEFTDEQWEKAIKSLVKEKFVEMNLKAFKLGREMKSS